ncbi:MAG: hypothetical protein EPO08_07525 [Rhodospirillaceae bacterium]|nr:MAG: hypothetical protein EPO08_07525 [Rhodospirillaceae bacterium]
MSYRSHDVWVPNKSVTLSPFAVFRDRGQIYNAATSAVRALHILELLASAERPLRAVEIAVAMGLSPSSANRLLKTMVDSAYLIFDPGTKRYHVSPRVTKFGSALADNYFGSGLIDRLMRSAHLTLGEMITLSTSQGSFMQLIDLVRPPQPARRARLVPVDSGIGMRIPLFGSCTGAAWLSSQSEKTIRASVRLCRRELGREANDVGPILERVKRVAEQGYAFGGVSAHDDMRGLAVPLPPCPNGVVLVLGAVGPSREMEKKRESIADLLKQEVDQFLGSKARD